MAICGSLAPARTTRYPNTCSRSRATRRFLRSRESSSPFGGDCEIRADHLPDPLRRDTVPERLFDGASVEAAEHVVADQRLGADRAELLRHHPPEHRGTHWNQRSGVSVSYRGGMLLTQMEMPSWAPTALTLASIALVASALVVLVRFWRNNNRR